VLSCLSFLQVILRSMGMMMRRYYSQWGKESTH